MTHVPPPVVALGAALAQRALTPSASRPGKGRSVTAATVAAASIGLAAATGLRFRQRGTTLDPFRPDRASALVTEGPNAITRNPMYVSLAGLLTAHALVRARWIALLPVAGFVALIDLLQIRAEEAALTTKFGAEYDAYRKATPRWLDQRSLAG